jgi:outer membrane protein insertion porin family
MLAHAFILALMAADPQAAPAPRSIEMCGMSMPAPDKAPPNTDPIVLAIALCFERQGGQSFIDAQTYLAYIQTRPSDPSENRWIPYTDETERGLIADFKRLWATAFLDDLIVDVRDYRFANGAIGKLVVFDMEERQRVKIVDYEGSSRVSRSSIDDELRKRELVVRLDSFVDPALLRRVAAAVRDLYSLKGYQFAEVKPVVTPIEGPGKRVNVTFAISEGPKVAIRDVQFLGNRTLSDEALRSALKDNRPQGLLSVVKGGGTYNEEKYADDAERIVDFYRDRGYIAVQVGQPQLRSLDDSEDGGTRWIQLRIPVTEGQQYRVGTVAVTGNTVVKSEALQSIFGLKPGDVYSQRRIRKSLEKARELYGSAGYFEFTAFPDLQTRKDAGIVDVTIRVDEGKQYFVNRITVAGNTHTKDDVVRRELMLVEAGVFNTEALKLSIRRLNQLGYFKTLEADGVEVQKAPDRDDRVDIRLKVQEQNRNQIGFGAGVSQYEGFFGNASFTTSNFMGRGETVTVSLQKGTRSNNYSVGFTEPYIFDRPITAGISLYSRKIDYQLYSATGIDYSEVRDGFTTVIGLSMRRFLRFSTAYGFEVANTASSADFRKAFSQTPGSAATAQVLDDGRHTQSSITPALTYNTVDQPLMPRRGMRLTASYQYAGGVLGGSSNFIRPEAEAILYVPVTRRTALGLRANAGWITNYSVTDLPYYQRYFLGGETQIRGVDIRSVGPLNANNAALGGTKFVLFNAEYYYDIAPMVRALLFHDAGQAFYEKHAIDLRQLRTSTGAELRVMLPVIGVPFRLIYSWNIYRDTFQPARGFKFAVGTTF